ncbi:hypothetical protein J3R30DRAFT_1354330 [Lentinula aciculospora]|uniref:Uncharacterized protein n=1 Tax=Lentinula aciculospora TaxID=153920 RepID=A0A9W9DTR3_9AGAR|nr:hypothetical protein J3R30DRAFT_1354330 [Lentinula aciculospora]
MFLLLAREIRDYIYDASLLALIENPPQPSTSPSPDHQIIPKRRHWEQIPLGRGTCFGLMYSCRQVYLESVESIERHNGVSFQLKLAVNTLENRNWGGERITPTWVQFPLLVYPNLPLGPVSTNIDINSKCQNFHLSFEIQSKERFCWWGDGGPAYLTQTLFNMLAQFLLHGPLGLHCSIPTKSDVGSTWDINTLAVDIITTFTDPNTGQLCTVPEGVVMDTHRQLSMQLGRVCVSGALSKRVRAVRLSVEGEIKREWLIDQGKRLSEKTKKSWACYGWVIDKTE